MSVAEPLSLNKPVLAFKGGIDLNHVDILRYSDLLYTAEDVYHKLTNIRDYRGEWADLVNEFKPEAVMKRFSSVFLGS